ncbi:hypothetical protein F511_11197 [Dorcoceras hygrometricum]|uniref:Uncharacterized protein n=1 Tax=Dorcoceras hygrometricum TaxID=472368 RepID=A0A2Z7CXM5_9LAMI|nr:hypothetical protein F511_11197 [Dorcoceras hygrometricum]
MQVEKRKRNDEGESDRNKGRVRRGDEGAKVEIPSDEEVEEFFVMMRRMLVAVEYFKKRNGLQLTAATWIPLLEREDFGRGNAVAGGDAKPGLDLNSDPVNEVEPDDVPGSA